MTVLLSSPRHATVLAALAIAAAVTVYALSWAQDEDPADESSSSSSSSSNNNNHNNEVKTSILDTTSSTTASSPSDTCTSSSRLIHHSSTSSPTCTTASPSSPPSSSSSTTTKRKRRVHWEDDATREMIVRAKTCRTARWSNRRRTHSFASCPVVNEESKHEDPEASDAKRTENIKVPLSVPYLQLSANDHPAEESKQEESKEPDGCHDLTHHRLVLRLAPSLLPPTIRPPPMEQQPPKTWPKNDWLLSVRPASSLAAPLPKALGKATPSSCPPQQVRKEVPTRTSQKEDPVVTSSAITVTTTSSPVAVASSSNTSCPPPRKASLAATPVHWSNADDVTVPQRPRRSPLGYPKDDSDDEGYDTDDEHEEEDEFHEFAKARDLPQSSLGDDDDDDQHDDGAKTRSRRTHHHDVSPVFATHPGSVEFYLPRVTTDTTVSSLSRLLRDWQFAFLQSVGLTDPDEFTATVLDCRPARAILALALKEWRMAQGYYRERSTECCATALYIWARTCRVNQKKRRMMQQQQGSKIKTDQRDDKVQASRRRRHHHHNRKKNKAVKAIPA